MYLCICVQLNWCPSDFPVPYGHNFGIIYYKRHMLGNFMYTEQINLSKNDYFIPIKQPIISNCFLTFDKFYENRI